jgi:hypothetical protein
MLLSKIFSGSLRSLPVQFVTVLWRLSFGGLLRSIKGIGANRLDDTLSFVGRERFNVLGDGV